MYPSLYYAVKDLFGLEIPFLKLIQSFGFFVAIAFLVAAYFFSRELKRKENEGLLHATTIKVLRGKKVTSSEYFWAALIGFILGAKILYMILHFNKMEDDAPGFFISMQGSLIGGIIGAGIALGIRYSDFTSERKKYNLTVPTILEEPFHPYQHIGNLTLLAALTGIIGAKIFHNLENWGDFVKDPMGSLFSLSGLTIYGGLICASIACIWYGHKNKIPTLHLIDAAAPALMIGYAVGRIGCQVAGDGDWGIDNLNPKPDWLSWAPDWVWSYDYAHNVNNDGVLMVNCGQEKFCYHLANPVYPTPFYETIMCVTLFLVLWSVRKRITTPGMLFSLYVLLNGIERFLIETIRINNPYTIGGFSFTQAQLISTIFILLGITGIFYFRKLERNNKFLKV
ncbi:MAG TPA: prolipoprotein diacylglyceryl transferase family protein [Bacteroidia bacterium]|jgi:prolipoprotein diacylglyceryl transferase|nr:prolipoprotein diacylglyceryl transferase family protein [Bacteroidia bacterium]